MRFVEERRAGGVGGGGAGRNCILYLLSVRFNVSAKSASSNLAGASRGSGLYDDCQKALHSVLLMQRSRADAELTSKSGNTATTTSDSLIVCMNALTRQGRGYRLVTELGLPCRGFTPPFRGQGWATRFSSNSSSSSKQASRRLKSP